MQPWAMSRELWAFTGGAVKKTLLRFFCSPFSFFLLCIVHHLSYPASRDGACGAEAFKLLCTELLKGMFISFFPGEERNEPKKEATDRNKFACVPGRSDAQP